MELEFQISRVLLVFATLIGSAYSARNYRSACRDMIALNTQEPGDPVVATIARGMQDDQFRLMFAQSVLLLAALLSLLGPVPRSPGSWPVTGVFVCLLCASLILAYKSYEQLQRRIKIIRLIARRRTQY